MPRIIVKSALDRFSQGKPALSRILMLVPHDPDLDPRVKWVIDLCAKLSRTDVIGFSESAGKPSREYFGAIYIERVRYADYNARGNGLYDTLFHTREVVSKIRSSFASLRTFVGSILSPLPLLSGLRYVLRLIGNIIPGHIYSAVRKCVRAILMKLGLLDHYRSWRGTKRRTTTTIDIYYAEPTQVRTIVIKLDCPGSQTTDMELTRRTTITADVNHAEPAQVRTIVKEVIRELNVLLDKLMSQVLLNKLMSQVHDFIDDWRYYRLIINTLYLRARALSVPPLLIICHDVFALAAAVKLKKIFKAPIIYDTHEFWPAADLQATSWENRFMASFEHRLVHQADTVITVSPQIAHTMERLYHIKNVICVPNAEPFNTSISPSSERPLSYPLKFLFQGRIAPLRGITELLEAWSRLEDERVILIIRAPENEHYVLLRHKFKKSVDKGQVIFVPPVHEAEMVAAASSADVGIIPYVGPNLNHVYCCPNKLSQYMHAGLAILSNDELEFVAETIKSAQCGRTYQASNPQSLIDNVRFWLDHPEQLIQMKKNAFIYACTEFNWGIKSLPYLQKIQEYIQ